MGKCKSCGASIIWAVTVSGKRVPLDAEPERRYILNTPNETNTVNDKEVVLRNTYATHFITCPNAASHRKGRGE